MRYCLIVALLSLTSFANAQTRPATPSVTVPLGTPAVCDGVKIDPSFSALQIQQAVYDNPTGTTFCFAGGTYTLDRYVALRDSNQFICTVRRTCIMTGLDQYRGAFTGVYNTTRHVIRGFVIEHFIAVPDQWPNAGLQVRDYGLMEDNEIRFNQIGISMTSNSTARGNYIHHNRQYGVAGGPADNILLENNEVSYNNTLHLDPNDNAGGSKIVGTVNGGNNLVWRNNYVHDNYGQGIWTDGNVRNTLYENNRILNNTGAGIDHEISWDAIVRNNILASNNTAELGLNKSCWWGAQIAINNSQNVEIYNNTILGLNTNALCMVNSIRNEQPMFPQVLANINVHDNIMYLRGVSNVGMVGNSMPANISFSKNIYYIENPAGAYWAFYKYPITRAEMQAAGQDTGATYIKW